MFNVIYIPKIEDEVTVASFNTKQEADAHMDHIAEVKPNALPHHYIQEVTSDDLESEITSASESDNGIDYIQ